MINDEITNQVTRRLIEIKSSLNSQIQDAISTAVADIVLPSIQDTLDTQSRANFTVMNRKSSRLQGSPGAVNSQKIQEDRPKSGFTLKNKQDTRLQHNRDRSYISSQYIFPHS